MLINCKLNPWEQHSISFQTETRYSLSRKCIWRCRLWSSGHFAQASMCQTDYWGRIPSSSVRYFTCQISRDTWTALYSYCSQDVRHRLGNNFIYVISSGNLFSWTFTKPYLHNLTFFNSLNGMDLLNIRIFIEISLKRVRLSPVISGSSMVQVNSSCLEKNGSKP